MYYVVIQRVYLQDFPVRYNIVGLNTSGTCFLGFECCLDGIYDTGDAILLEGLNQIPNISTNLKAATEINLILSMLIYI